LVQNGIVIRNSHALRRAGGCVAMNLGVGKPTSRQALVFNPAKVAERKIFSS
jgi:hypothetical protein